VPQSGNHDRVVGTEGGLREKTGESLFLATEGKDFTETSIAGYPTTDRDSGEIVFLGGA
jgi:hypothetical protein